MPRLMEKIYTFQEKEGRGKNIFVEKKRKIGKICMIDKFGCVKTRMMELDDNASLKETMK